jgi:hypothetical protein
MGFFRACLLIISSLSSNFLSPLCFGTHLDLSDPLIYWITTQLNSSLYSLESSIDLSLFILSFFVIFFYLSSSFSYSSTVFFHICLAPISLHSLSLSSNFPALFTFPHSYLFLFPSFIFIFLPSPPFFIIFFIYSFSLLFILLLLLVDSSTIAHLQSWEQNRYFVTRYRYSLRQLSSIFPPSLDLPILPTPSSFSPFTVFLSRSISRRDCSRSRAIVKPNSSSARWICGHHCGPKLGGSGLLKILLHISNLILQIILTLNALASTLFSPS